MSKSETTNSFSGMPKRRRPVFIPLLIVALAFITVAATNQDSRTPSQVAEPEKRTTPKPLDLASMRKDTQATYGKSCTAKLVCEIPAPSQRGQHMPWDADPPVAFAPDGASLAIADYSGRIKLFEVSSGKELAATEVMGTNPYKPQALGDDLDYLTFSPDSKTLIATGGNANYVLNARTLKLRYKFLGIISNSLNVSRPQFRPDGSAFLAAKLLDQKLHKYEDLAFWSCNAPITAGGTLSREYDNLRAWAVSPDGQAFVETRFNRERWFEDLRCVNISNKSVRWVINDIDQRRMDPKDASSARNPNNVGSAKILQFAPDSSTIIVALEHYLSEHGPARSSRRFLRIVDATSGKVSGLIVHLGFIENVRVLEKYGALVNRRSGRQMRVTPLASLPLDSPATAIPPEDRSALLALNPDGLLFAVENSSSGFDLYFTVDNQKIPVTFEQNIPSCQPRTFSPYGQYLATFSTDKVRIWKFEWKR